MHGDATLRELASPAFVGVSESDSVIETVRLMAEEAVESAVVLRGTEPVGTLTAAGILQALADEEDLDDLNVGDLMGGPPATLPADERPETATAVLANGARQIVVTVGDELLGTISARDLLAAQRLETRSGDPEADFGEPAVESDRIEGTLSASIADADHRQGICESCGTLTQDLSPVNGQLLCPDCRGV